MPLMKLKPGSIPEFHDSGCVCVLCEATENLTPGDWDIVRFFVIVRDQCDNLAPMGTDDGKAWLVPRLDAWESALRIFSVPRECWAQTVSCCVALFYAVRGEMRDPEPWLTPAYALADSDDGV